MLHEPARENDLVQTLLEEQREERKLVGAEVHLDILPRFFNGLQHQS